MPNNNSTNQLPTVLLIDDDPKQLEKRKILYRNHFEVKSVDYTKPLAPQIEEYNQHGSCKVLLLDLNLDGNMLAGSDYLKNNKNILDKYGMEVIILSKHRFDTGYLKHIRQWAQMFSTEWLQKGEEHKEVEQIKQVIERKKINIYLNYTEEHATYFCPISSPLMTRLITMKKNLEKNNIFIEVKSADTLNGDQDASTAINNYLSKVHIVLHALTNDLIAAPGIDPRSLDYYHLPNCVCANALHLNIWLNECSLEAVKGIILNTQRQLISINILNKDLAQTIIDHLQHIIQLTRLDRRLTPTRR